MAMYIIAYGSRIDYSKVIWGMYTNMVVSYVVMN